MSVSSVGSGSCLFQRPSFVSTDTDNDGALSLGEFGAIGQNVQGGNNGLDSDSIQKIFSAIDSDGDGKISRTEATSAFNKLSSALQSGLLGAQEEFGGPPPPPPGGGMFASADTDGSGGLSFDEFKTAATSDAPQGAEAPSDDKLKAIFDKLDTNGDGVVSQDEMKAAHKGHHHHHAPPPDTSSDPSAVASANPANTDSSAAATANTGADALFQQAVAAYGNVNQTATNLVSQIVDLLQKV